MGRKRVICCLLNSRGLLLTVVTAIVFFIPLCLLPYHETIAQDQNILNRYVVVMRQGYMERVDKHMSNNLPTDINGVENIKLINNNTHGSRSIFTVLAHDEYKDLLEAHDEVEYITVDEKVQVNQIDENQFGICTSEVNVPWNLDRIDQEELPLDGTYSIQGSLNDGTGVTVYLLDTGVNDIADEFSGRLEYASDVRLCTTESNCDGTKDESGHGTYMAGIIASKTYGVAKGAKLVVVKCMDGNGEGFWSDVVTGLFWTLHDWILKKKPPAVVSISLSGPRVAAINEMVELAVGLGMVVVVSAGNDGENACDFTPASSSAVITVGSSDQSDRYSWFANYGPCVDVVAPGRAVASLSGTGSPEQQEDETAPPPPVYTGTSLAAAHVTGAIARYMSSHLDEPDKLTPDACKQWLLDWAVPNKISSPSGTTEKLLNVNRYCQPPKFPFMGIG